MKKTYTKPAISIAFTGIVAVVGAISGDDGKNAASDSEHKTDWPETGSGTTPGEAKHVWGCDWSVYEDW